MRLQNLRTLLSGKAGGSRDTEAPDAASALDAASTLVNEGRILDAVDLLARAYSSTPTPELASRLIALRHEAAMSLPAARGARWSDPITDPFPDVSGRVPEIDRRDLTSEILTGAVVHHGALIVRTLFDEAQVARTLESLRRAAEMRAEVIAGRVRGDTWYDPFPAGDAAMSVRRMVAGRGGTWLADSPAATAQVLDDLAASNAVAVIDEHFGARPVFSLQKSTLRCSEPVNAPTGWHQDGSFLGPDARAMNVWIALSPCGGDRRTPGLEVVPRRVPEVLPKDGVLGAVSIAVESVGRAAIDTPPVHPQFDAGDSIMFDERFLHRTYLTEGMTHERYALECWMFAPGFGTEQYISLVT